MAYLLERQYQHPGHWKPVRTALVLQLDRLFHAPKTQRMPYFYHRLKFHFLTVHDLKGVKRYLYSKRD